MPSDSTVAIVTGASGGIGRHVVDRLARDGVTVVAVDRRAAEGDLAAGVVPMRADVTNPGDVDRVVARTEADVGPITFLVNAAGIMCVAPIEEFDDQSWREVFAVNSMGVYLMIRAVLKPMTARRRGSVVTLSSNAARVPRAGLSAYCASKAAATMFTKCAALEAAEFGIRCNVVSPGSTDTDMLRQTWAGEDRRDVTVTGVPEQFRLGIPLRRIATPDDVTDVVAFLLSDGARHVTMQDVTVDGGSTLGA